MTATAGPMRPPVHRADAPADDTPRSEPRARARRMPPPTPRDRADDVAHDPAVRALLDAALATAIEAVLDTLPHPAAVVDDGGRIAALNHAWHDGVDAASPPPPWQRARVDGPAMAALPTTPHLAPLSARTLAARLRAVVDGRERTARVQWSHHDGATERWVETRLSRLDWPRRWVTIVHRDVTAERRAVLGASDQHAQIAHLARIRTMGALAASLAHELSQPIAAIRANTQAARLQLAAGTPDLGELQVILADIERDDERAGAVLTQLRGLMRNEAPTRAPIDTASLVRDACALATGEARVRRVTLALELPPELPPVFGDRVQLLQVLLNLVLNAMDASGEVAADDERRVAVRGQVVGDEMELAVVDRGPGIAPEQRSRVFEPFFTTKPHGIGVGLWLARAIVEAHGGRIWCENAPERGATFLLRLPLAPTDP